MNKIQIWTIKAEFTYWLHGKIGWKYPYAVNGKMIERRPKIQRWLAKIGDWPDSW